MTKLKLGQTVCIRFSEYYRAQQLNIHTDFIGVVLSVESNEFIKLSNLTLSADDYFLIDSSLVHEVN